MSLITLAGIQADAQVIAKSDEYSARNGIPVNVGRAIVLAEDPMNTKTGGDGGTSWGPLQLHQNGGQGTGYTAAQLRNLDTNFTIGMPHVARAWVKNAGLPPLERMRRTAAESGHPGDPQVFPMGSSGRVTADAGTARIVAIYARLEGEAPSPATAAGDTIAGVPLGALRDTLDNAVAYAQAHPVQAAAAIAAALLVLA